MAVADEAKSAELIARLEQLPFSRWHQSFFILAFFGIMLVSTLLSGLFYRISMESAVSAANQRTEKMIVTLSRGEGPIES